MFLLSYGLTSACLTAAKILMYKADGEKRAGLPCHEVVEVGGQEATPGDRLVSSASCPRP